MEGLATGGGWVLSSERNVVGSWKAFGQTMQGMWKSRRLLPMGVVAGLTVEQIPSWRTMSGIALGLTFNRGSYGELLVANNHWPGRALYVQIARLIGDSARRYEGLARGRTVDCGGDRQYR